MVYRILTIALVMSLGCAELDESAPHTIITAKAGTTDDWVRFELTNIQDDWDTVNYADLLNDGSVTELVTPAGSELLDSALRKILLVWASEQRGTTQEYDVRTQRFSINRDFPALKVLGQRAKAFLPFPIKAAGYIEFARLISADVDQKNHAFTLLDIPHDADSTLALPEGTVVTIPVQAQVSFDVGGGFLARSAQISKTLAPYLDSTASSSVSAARRGTVFGQGRFRLQIIRLNGARVRVRLLSSAQQSLHASANLGSFLAARYAFLPAAHLDRLRSLRRRLDQLDDGWQWVAQGEERIKALREHLPDAVRTIVDTIPLAKSEKLDEAIHRTINASDAILAEAERMATSASELDRRIGDRVRTVIDASKNVWDQKIAPVTQRINALSSRVFSLAQSVQLDDKLSRYFRMLADYEFDLEDEDARIAFDRGISGRAVWRGAVEAFRHWDANQVPFADFTLADTLANADQGKEFPRVRRLSQAGADLRRREHSAQLSAFGMSFGLRGEFQNNRVFVRDENGKTSTWNTQAWERGQNSNLFGNVRAETFASGVFMNETSDERLHGGYWFRWKKTFGDRAVTPVAKTLAHVLNDLGPMAVIFGVDQLYQGEYFGKLSADLFVAFDTEALDVIFDPSQTSPEFLWNVLGDMMTRYEKPTFLPYAYAPIRPPSLVDIPGAEENCERVAQTLGGRYCYSFVDRIFPALQRAQTLNTPESRLDFFESFYRVPAGGAVLSTRFLVRFLSEILHAHDRHQGVSLALELWNRHDDSVGASPKLYVGTPKALILADATLVEGFNAP